MILTALLFFVAPVLPVAPMQLTTGSSTGRFEVNVFESPDGPLLTVRADDAPVEKVVQNIARQLKMQLEGFQDVNSAVLVGVYFEKRPFSEAIHWILGAAGLRAQVSADTIRVLDDTPPFPTPEDLFDLAEVTWIRALRRSPGRSEGVRAEMALAEIQESRGALAAAVNHYEYLIERHPNSEYVPEAMLLSGIHLGELDEWESAAKRFQELTRLAQPHPYHALARLELARALCFAHQPTSALYTLEALEQHYPPTSDQDKRARLVLRGRALALTGKPIDALRALDLADRYSIEGMPGIDVLEVRAMALDRATRFGEAAVAWLQLADRTGGETRTTAVANAARSGLEAGDELGVLFIEAWAHEEGSEAPVEVYATEARMRIGLQTESIIHLTDRQRLAHGARLLEAGNSEQAVRGLQLLYQNREKLDEALLLELALVYAKALDAETLTDMAIDVLEDTAARLHQKDDRRRIYVLASTIFENHNRLQEALDALEGRL